MKTGFYWVTLHGELTIGEFIEDCHWLVVGSEEFVRTDEFDCIGEFINPEAGT